MTAAPPTTGIRLRPCDTVRANWSLIAVDAIDLEGDPSVAFLPVGAYPDTATPWQAATWFGAAAQTGDGWTRILWALVAGPEGLTTGNPVLVGLGEWSTWVRVASPSTRRDTQAQLLQVG